MVCRDPILEENKNYWTDRAPGYSEVNRLELATAQRQRWSDCICEELTRRFPDRPLADLQVLEVGTGPGFFAILLRELGCDVVELNCAPTGEFAHNPEPLAENLREISAAVVREKADLGVVVDPDVDRLAFISEDGTMFGEEYTLVSVADYVLSERPGNTVSNLSSTRALRDVTRQHGGRYYASAVGEVNVTTKMKEVGAVIGGEGNGGVIYPELHYGRDALVGVALFLTYLAQTGLRMTALRATYPAYYASKNKIALTPAIDVDKVLREIKDRYAGEQVNDIDGVKIDFAENWVHLRKSNTEPIIRIYTEARSMAEADALAQRFIGELREICNL